MMTKEEAIKKIKSLVERFDEQKEFYRKSEYNETQTRRDFIDPFWKALGWDVDNENGYAESYREVIHEDRVKVGGATKAPDYSFRLAGGKRLFFLATMSDKKRFNKKYKQQIIESIQQLDLYEKSVLREFFIQGKHTLQLPIDDESVVSLTNKGILDQHPNSNIVSAFDMRLFYSISKIALDNLTE